MGFRRIGFYQDANMGQRLGREVDEVSRFIIGLGSIHCHSLWPVPGNVDAPERAPDDGYFSAFVFVACQPDAIPGFRFPPGWGFFVQGSLLYP